VLLHQLTLKSRHVCELRDLLAAASDQQSRKRQYRKPVEKT
jgi:hypothetical protein